LKTKAKILLPFTGPGTCVGTAIGKYSLNALRTPDVAQSCDDQALKILNELNEETRPERRI
jgi:hypothetical protein